MTPKPTTRQAQYQKRKARAGVCMNCDRPRDYGGLRCEYHAEEKRVKAKARYDKRRAAGVCPQCAKAEAVTGSIFCQKCKDRAAEVKRRFREREKKKKAQRRKLVSE